MRAGHHGCTPITSRGEPQVPGRAHYHLRCRWCGARFVDDGFMVSCPGAHPPSLLVSQYDARELRPDSEAEGMFRFRGWLPAAQHLVGTSSRIVTYRSPELSRLTGLSNLWIGFNGYCPKRGANLATGTFKDLEASSVLARLPPGQGGRTLVLASAGNTAAAFARACSEYQVRCLIVVPRSGLVDLRFAGPIDSCVTVVSLTGNADYSDAVALADQLSERLSEMFFSTGGVASVARRDGVGTAMLNAVETIGRLPDYYFQAVGSGAGGIAAFEASCRLVADGRFGERPPRLMLSQNLPYAPMVASWRSGHRALLPTAEEADRAQIRRIAAPVLSNRRPAYALTGGVFDVLRHSGGDMLAVDNDEVRAAQRLVEDAEGIDIDPAAAVAVASLMRAVHDQRIQRDDVILLNVTGAGRRRLERGLAPVHPTLEVDPTAGSSRDTTQQIVDSIG